MKDLTLPPTAMFRGRTEMRTYRPHESNWYTTNTDYAYLEFGNGPDDTTLYVRVGIIATYEDDSGRHAYIDDIADDKGWWPVGLLFVPAEPTQ